MYLDQQGEYVFGVYRDLLWEQTLGKLKMTEATRYSDWPAINFPRWKRQDDKTGNAEIPNGEV